MRQCVEEIERRGMEEVGIYRVSGVATDIQALKAAFDVSEYRPGSAGHTVVSMLRLPAGPASHANGFRVSFSYRVSPCVRQMTDG